MLVAMRALCLVSVAMALCGCGSALVQSETSPQLPSRPVRAIGAYVAGPNSLAASFQANIAVEAARHGLAADNIAVLFPPTRAYADAEIRQGLAARAIDSVMIIKIGDAPGQRQYGGTILQERLTASGGPTAAAVAAVNGNPTPTIFSARLIDAATGRKLWDGDGQIASGAFSLFANGTTVADAVAALFDDLQEKGMIAQPAN
jgi:hypothetical protein